MLFLRYAAFLVAALWLDPANLAQAQDVSGWNPDLDATMQAAAQEGQPILLLLEIEAQSDADLIPRLTDAVSDLKDPPRLARLTYPAEPYAKVAIAQKFVLWADLTGVTQLPALAWLDSEGRPYAVAELSGTDPAAGYTPLMKQLSDQYAVANRAFTEAQSLSGIDKARRLHEGVQQITESCRPSYLDIMQQIVELDPDNTASLREVYEPILVNVLLDVAIQEQIYPLIDSGSYAEARSILNRLAEQHAVSPAQKQLLLAFQAELLHSEGQTDLAIEALDDAIAIAPESASAAKLEETKRRLTNP